MRRLAIAAALLMALSLVVYGFTAQAYPKKPNPHWTAISTPSMTVSPSPTPTPTETPPPPSTCGCPDPTPTPEPAVFKTAGEGHSIIWATALVAAVFLAVNPMMGFKQFRFGHPLGLATVPCPSITRGAPQGSPTLGQTNYFGTDTTYVSNTIFDASHSDDLVRVNNGHVVFDHVTFRGTGTGATGHTLEIKVGGSAEVRNSVFEGHPVEDTIQTEGNGTTLIECNDIGGTPGEDHIDTKPGGTVTIRNNNFTTPPTFNDVQMHNAYSPVYTLNNTGIDKIFYELPDTYNPAIYDSTGQIVGNDVATYIWLYDVTNVLVEGNTVPLVKHGDAGTRDPEATYFLNNQITTFQFNGGTCYKDGNTGNALSSCTAGPPPWY